MGWRSEAIFAVFHTRLAALARIFSIIASHEDLQTHTNIAIELATFIAHNVCPVISERLRAIAEGCEMRAEMEDVRSVLFAVVSVATSVLWALLIELQHDANIQTLTSSCEAMIEKIRANAALKIYPVSTATTSRIYCHSAALWENGCGDK
uniref:Uncharacterized protein n=1 Tax=Ascaris lumbricoides TaxID=6252 RepID=A0A9J2Q206_ASCLU